MDLIIKKFWISIFQMSMLSKTTNQGCLQSGEGARAPSNWLKLRFHPKGFYFPILPLIIMYECMGIAQTALQEDKAWRQPCRKSTTNVMNRFITS